MAPNTTLTLRLCAVALLRNNVVRLHDGRFQHLLFIYANLGTLERVDHFHKNFCEYHKLPYKCCTPNSTQQQEQYGIIRTTESPSLPPSAFVQSHSPTVPAVKLVSCTASRGATE